MNGLAVPVILNKHSCYEARLLPFWKQTIYLAAVVEYDGRKEMRV